MTSTDRPGGSYERILAAREAESTELADKKNTKDYLKRKWEDDYNVESQGDRTNANRFPHNLRVSAEDVDRYLVNSINPSHALNPAGLIYSSSILDSPKSESSAINSPLYPTPEDRKFISVFEVLENSDATRLSRWNDLNRENIFVSDTPRRPLSPSRIDPNLLNTSTAPVVKIESPPMNTMLSNPQHARHNQIKQPSSIPKAALSVLPAFIPSRPPPQSLPNKQSDLSLTQLNPLVLPDHSHSDFKLPSHYLIQCVPWYFYVPRSLTLDGMHQCKRIQPLRWEESPYILPENLILGDEDAEVERYEPELEEVITIFNGLKESFNWWQHQKILDFENAKKFGDGVLRFGIHEGWKDVF